jgi:UDP-N-acetylglucosamine transferase subunit ALG13
MIFLTVGTQLAFDRLVTAVDTWAGMEPGRDVVAQIGPTDIRPRHLRAQAFFEPAECRQLMIEADVIVAHAGMGTILSALELAKPLLVVPRKAALGEHRNDHQVATAARFAELGRLSVAADELELVQRLDQLETLTANEQIGPYASDHLVSALRTFIAAS